MTRATILARLRAVAHRYPTVACGLWFAATALVACVPIGLLMPVFVEKGGWFMVYLVPAHTAFYSGYLLAPRLLRRRDAGRRVGNGLNGLLVTVGALALYSVEAGFYASAIDEGNPAMAMLLIFFFGTTFVGLIIYPFGFLAGAYLLRALGENATPANATAVT